MKASEHLIWGLKSGWPKERLPVRIPLMRKPIMVRGLEIRVQRVSEFAAGLRKRNAFALNLVVLRFFF